jgi:signal transduction histidine kinase
VAYYQFREVQANIDDLENDALASVELVDRMGLDIERERLLIDRHIYATERSAMSAIEDRIAAVKVDFAAAARTYTPLAAFDGEPAAWQQLQDDVAAVEQPIAEATDLSRANRDAEAQAHMVALEPRFEMIEADVARLVEINVMGAEVSTANVSHALATVRHLRLALALGVIALTAAVGVVVARRILAVEWQSRNQALELESKNRELDAFSGRVAHDLRGPLNTVSLAASLVSEQMPADNPTTTIMRRGIAQMTDLLEDLLALSRLGGMRLDAVARTEPVMAAVEKDLTPMVRDVGGELIVDVDPATVRCSEALLRQVLWNLGENAVKYRRVGIAPRIELVGRAIGRDYQVRVTDNGVGLSAEEVGHVFQPFFRGERTRKVEGTGLGLAIVKRVVEASGGGVSVASQPGAGTTFVVQLPLQAPRAAA